MVVFGVLSMLHDASLSSVGAGLWSGAMAMGNGVVGLMASLNGCLSPERTLSPLSVTIYLALCLVSVGVSNLAIILTAIGLLKDSQKPYYIMPKDKVSCFQTGIVKRFKMQTVLIRIILSILNL